MSIPSLSVEKADEIDRAVQNIDNHFSAGREDATEFERISCTEVVNLGMCHDSRIFLWIESAELHCKVDVESLNYARREERLKDVSLFFEQVVRKINSALRCIPDKFQVTPVDPKLDFQGRDTDAFYRDIVSVQRD